jgi:hypothetical protein
VEATAQVQMKSKDPRASYLFYLDGLTPEEWVELLKRVGDQDRSAETNRRGTGQFHSLFVSRMTDFDRKEFGEYFGPLTKPATRIAPDTPGPEPARSGTSRAEHHSLLVPFSPLRPLPRSPDVKQFFENPPPVRPGSLQIILVLRGAEG